MESSQTELAKPYHLPKTNRVVTGKNSRVGRGLGQHCYLCGKLIEELPYFSHLSGGAHRMHYYHIECAKKVNLL